MTTNRRNFLKTATIAGAGAVTGSLISGCTAEQPASNLAGILESAKKTHAQAFNMSGYAAPPIPVVRAGVVGLGDRGSEAVKRLSFIEGVEITALCDIRKAALEGSQNFLKSVGRPEAREYTGDDNAWKKLAELPDLDLIYIGYGILRWQFMPWRTESTFVVRFPLPVRLMKPGSLLKHRKGPGNIA
jgi:hypothetical protein